MYKTFQPWFYPPRKIYGVFDLNSGTYDVTTKLWMIKLYHNISDVDHANVT